MSVSLLFSTERKKRRTFLNPSTWGCSSLVIVVLFLFQILFIVNFGVHLAQQQTPIEPQIRKSLKPQPPNTNPHITVWDTPHSCSGNFTSVKSPHSPFGFPYAVLREASVDRRPVIANAYPEKSGPGIYRILLFVTVHLSARIADSSWVTIDDIACDVEHITQINKVNSVYHPGDVIWRKKEVSEYQIEVVVPRRARRDSSLIRAKLHLNLFDGQHQAVEMTLPLRCVMGWELPALHTGRSDCTHGAEHADGAAVFISSPLYGGKRRRQVHQREIAHVAARALLGPVAFDAIYITIPNNNSLSQMDLECGQRKACRARLDADNDAFMASVADTVESELRVLGVPHHVYRKIHLVPICRLGTHAQHERERYDPCMLSHAGGQYMTLFYARGMVAPYYRWSASYDLDEFFAGIPESSGGASVAGIRKKGRAVDVLDSVDAHSEPPNAGYMHFPWINFYLTTRADARITTEAVMDGSLPRLVNREVPEESSECYNVFKKMWGKPAVRCDVGIGFAIHFPLIQLPKPQFEDKEMFRVGNGLATWHARFKFSKTNCTVEKRVGVVPSK